MLNIGIDAGGTTTDVAVADEASEQRFTSSGVNLRRDGLPATSDTIVAAVRQAFECLGLATDVGARLVVGVAGAGDTGTHSILEERLVQHFGPQFHPVVITDAELALFTAHEDRRGAIVIVGTGSIALIRENGCITRRGGLGYLLGDEASGYALGRAGARHLASCYDRGFAADGESSAEGLASALARALDVSDLTSVMDVVYGQHYPLQRLAQVVLSLASAGDAAAMAIVEREIDAFGRVLDSLDASRKHDLGVISVCLFGGLMGDEYYRSLLCQRALPAGWAIANPAFPDAVTGALNMARRRGDVRL